MIVQVWRQESGQLIDISVFGEKLQIDEDGHFLLPGSYITALKAEDLPEGIAFKVCDPPHPGLCFYQEDKVSFTRDISREGLLVKVTSTYEISEWDGLFSLQATMESRRSFIENSVDYRLEDYKKEDAYYQVSFSFVSHDILEHDLEKVIESVACKVRWVEEKGNAYLIYGTGYM